VRFYGKMPKMYDKGFTVKNCRDSVFGEMWRYENMMYKLQKYKWWELWFYQYKFVRKLSGAFWVKLKEEGYDWVKMDKEHFLAMKFPRGVNFEIEDWT